MRARRCSVSAHSTVPAARDGSCHPPVLQIGTRRHREVKRLVLGDRATATTPGLDPGPPPFRGRGGHGDTRVSQPRASADTGRSTHAPFHRPCRPQAHGHPPEDRPPETEHPHPTSTLPGAIPPLRRHPKVTLPARKRPLPGGPHNLSQPFPSLGARALQGHTEPPPHSPNGVGLHGCSPPAARERPPVTRLRQRRCGVGTGVNLPETAASDAVSHRLVSQRLRGPAGENRGRVSGGRSLHAGARQDHVAVWGETARPRGLARGGRQPKGFRTTNPRATLLPTRQRRELGIQVSRPVPGPRSHRAGPPDRRWGHEGSRTRQGHQGPRGYRDAPPGTSRRRLWHLRKGRACSSQARISAPPKSTLAQ